MIIMLISTMFSINVYADKIPIDGYAFDETSGHLIIK